MGAHWDRWLVPMQRGCPYRILCERASRFCLIKTRLFFMDAAPVEDTAAPAAPLQDRPVVFYWYASSPSLLASSSFRLIISLMSLRMFFPGRFLFCLLTLGTYPRSLPLSSKIDIEESIRSERGPCESSCQSISCSEAGGSRQSGTSCSEAGVL